MISEMEKKLIIKQQFKKLKCCVLIPTYNNEKTIEQVIQSTFEYCDEVIVINDGCTDSTVDILKKTPNLIVINHPINKGKGLGLRNGFAKAVELGFDYAILWEYDYHVNEKTKENLTNFLSFIHFTFLFYLFKQIFVTMATTGFQICIFAVIIHSFSSIHLSWSLTLFYLTHRWNV